MHSLSAPLRFLIIRRDNIGDLVCTTPLLRALRAHYPGAYIAALVNSYNRSVVENNPDINALFSYTKLKHRAHGRSIVRTYLERLRLLMALRRMRFDYIILAGPGFLSRVLRTARFINPRHIIGFTDPNQRSPTGLDGGIPYALPLPLHEAEDVFRLLAPLGIQGKPPCMSIVTDPESRLRAQGRLADLDFRGAAMLIGIHISARKPGQRWPAAHFVELIRKLHTHYKAAFILFWSPGAADNALHPGDDDKADQIMAQLKGLPIMAYPTQELRDLIGALSLCDFVICSDGGAMHIAAALGKPIVCFFGNSDKTRWYPWGVPHVLLQPESLDVSDISVDMAMSGFEKLLSLSGADASIVVPVTSHTS